MSSTEERRATRERFLDAVHLRVDPTMVDRFGFTRNIDGIGIDPDGEARVLYEHDPAEFARRFPRLKHRFGTDVAPCIDIWLEFDTRSGQLSDQLGDLFDFDGWLRASGRASRADLIWDANGDVDQRMTELAEAFAAYFTEQPSWE